MKPINKRSSDYIFARAYGEVFRLPPIEIVAIQNRAANKQAPLDVIDFDEHGAWQTLYDIRDRFMRQLVETRAAALYAEKRTRLAEAA